MARRDDFAIAQLTWLGFFDQAEAVRTVLYEAANILLVRVQRFSALKRWALDVAKRRQAGEGGAGA